MLFLLARMFSSDFAFLFLLLSTMFCVFGFVLVVFNLPTEAVAARRPPFGGEGFLLLLPSLVGS